MKVSVSTYSFSKLINKGIMTQLDCISKAKEMGFDAVEIESIHPHDNSSIYEYAEKLSIEAKRADIEISNFTFGADFLNGCNGNIEEEIARVKGMVDTAEILGVSSVRHDATTGYQNKYKSFNSVLSTIAYGCREVTEYAVTKGIKTMVENHGVFCQDSDRVEKLVNAVGHENFGLLLDMGNFLCADENPALAFGRVAPYAFYVHAKDFHIKSPMNPNPGEGFFRSRNGNYLRGAIIGHGDVPVLHCIEALNQVNYNGYISIEFEGMEEPSEALRIGLDNLRRYIGNAYSM